MEPKKTDLSWKERIASLGNIGKLLSMLWETSPMLLTAASILRLSRSVIPVLLLWIPKLIIDDIVHLRQGIGSTSRVWVLLSFELGLALLSDVLARYNNLADSLLGDRFTDHVAVRIMRHAALLDLAVFEDPIFYDKLERIRNQANSRMSLFVSLFTVLQELLTLCILSTGLYLNSPWLLLLVLVSTTPAFFGEAHFTRLAYSIFYGRTAQRRELEYLRLLGSCIESAKEIRIFNLGEHLVTKYKESSESIYNENRDVALKRAKFGAVLGTMSAFGYYGGYAYTIAAVLAGTISLGSFTFLTGSFARSRASCEKILGNFTEISQQAVFLTDMFEFFLMQPSIRTGEKPLTVPAIFQSGFEFRNVSFAYPGSKRMVVKNINMHIRPCEKVAFVGENGAGKTTLVKLLARLYEPTEGQILLDGIDLREYDLTDLRRQISVVFQDFMRYDLTVRENVGFGDIALIDDDRHLTMATTKSEAQSLVDRFSLGLNQVLGKRFEGGVELSGGEWQKIALARAHCRQAQLIILDEPTASLDARAEHNVFTQLADLLQGRMAVLISHRFSTVRMADKIIVLRGGEIYESGSHDALMKLGGYYAELFELQAVGFRESGSSVLEHGMIR